MLFSSPPFARHAFHSWHFEVVYIMYICCVFFVVENKMMSNKIAFLVYLRCTGLNNHYIALALFIYKKWAFVTSAVYIHVLLGYFFSKNTIHLKVIRIVSL